MNDLPVVDYPVIPVQANYPGASPDTVANNIATPLERQFMQINGLELVTSQSTQGHVSFTLQFALDKSIDAAATDVQTAISQATGSLPTDLPSPPTFSKTNPNDQPILYIALTSDSVTPGQLYDYGSTQVGQRISILPGVSSVNVFGTKSRHSHQGRSLEDVGARNFDRRSGPRRSRTARATRARDSLTARRARRCCGPTASSTAPQAYGNLIVSSTNGAPVYLRDVADGAKTRCRTSASRCGSGCAGTASPSATVVVAVNRQAGSNAVAVAKSVRDLLPHHQRGAAGIGARHADLRPLADHRQFRGRTCRPRCSSHSFWWSP